MTDLPIPVIVVDDTRSDRYIVRRRLSRHTRFDQVMEVPTGEQFLDDFFNPPISERVEGRKTVILMDINMPWLDGFQTVEQLAERLSGGGPDSMVVMMFTSSNNPADRQRAQALPMVKGYIVKPLDDAGVEQILRLYDQAA